LPVDESIAKDFTLEEHPQYVGLKNIIDLILKYNQKNSKFANCLGITVEPGINNVERNYMYYKGSLNWKSLNRKLKEAFGESFTLSDVDNKMELGRGTKYKTHLKRGVAVKVIFEGKEFICLPTDSENKKKELDALLKKLSHENKEAVKIYIPYIEGLERECRQLQLKL
jgi:hypothetical protein